MTLLKPTYTEDIKYPAYIDRLLTKSLARPGVVNPNDFKVTENIGNLQVKVGGGYAFVEQTVNKLEPLNKKYNGLYHVVNTEEINPSNNVIVNSSNPQMAQIILRIYDNEEMGIGGGESLAKVEWLNGIPQSGVTIDNRTGAATLPENSLRLADVLVPKNALNSASFTIRDRRPWAHGAYARTNVSNVEQPLGTNVIEGLAVRVECNNEAKEVYFNCVQSKGVGVDELQKAELFSDNFNFGNISINGGYTSCVTTLGSHLFQIKLTMVENVDTSGGSEKTRAHISADMLVCERVSGIANNGKS